MNLPHWAIGLGTALVVAATTGLLTTGRDWDRELVSLRGAVQRLEEENASIREDMQSNAYVRPAPETLARLVAAEREIAEIKRRLEQLEHRRIR